MGGEGEGVRLRFRFCWEDDEDGVGCKGTTKEGCDSSTIGEWKDVSDKDVAFFMGGAAVNVIWMCK